jgi:hypothetical protein
MHDVPILPEGDERSMYARWKNIQIGESHAPESVAEVFDKIVSANQQATVLGWAGVIVTGILLAVDIVGVGRIKAQEFVSSMLRRRT